MRNSRHDERQLHAGLSLGLLCHSLPIAAWPKMPDVVIYGGTSAGVAAAVQVQRMGKTARAD